MDPNFIKTLYLRQQDCPSCPSPESVSQWFTELLAILFPDFARLHFSSQRVLALHLEKLTLQLEGIRTQSPAKSEAHPCERSDLIGYFFTAK